MERKEILENGKIVVFQDNELYTFTSDSILLSKFASVKKGDIVADFCAGSGIVGLNTYALNSGLIKSLTFFELQKPLFSLLRKSLEKNDLKSVCTAINCRLQDIDKRFNEKFSLILCNPPYMKVSAGETNSDKEKAICTSEIELTLAELCLSFSKHLKFGGRVCLVHRADRLAEVVYELKKNNIEPKRLQMVSAGNKQPYLFLMEGVKGGKSGLKVLSPVQN